MTKLKSRKLTKSTFAIVIMAIAMVAMIAFGGTYAYFTATANSIDADTIKTAHVMLSKDSATAEITASKDQAALPGDTITLNASVTNNSNRKVYIFVQLLIDASSVSNMTLDLINGTNGTGHSSWTAASQTGYSNVFYIALDDDDGTVTFNKTAVLSESVDSSSSNGTAGGNMDKTITLTAKFAATQYAKTTDASGTETALTVAEAFALVKNNFTADPTT